MNDLPPLRHSVTFSMSRVTALVLRYVYLLRASWPRLFDLIYWPTIQLLMWGFLQVYLSQQTGAVAQAAGIFLGAVFLWDILFRGQLGFTISFLEEMYSRNLGHLMVSPLRPAEFVAALMTMSIIRILIGLVPVSLLALAYFDFNLYAMGPWLIVFFFNLILTSWAVGLFVCGLLLRYGLGAENIAWSLMFLFMPLACVYYPLATLPDWLQSISLAMPPTYVFESMRSLLLHDVVRTDLMVTALALNALYFLIGAAGFAWFHRDARIRGQMLSLGE
ncbi:ABC-2 type transport system permease protein [Rhodoligotrophos appendicifer]|uniref:ABC transporter permease n=1 Tax=Rhodoligotrophos appendicifer TaxID=987056 RepID=UPI00117D3276|nr:ABC transporter permease [Rhodoligotrophos appendicifer]